MLQKGPSRKDDLVSIMYVLIFLSEGSLPWSHIKESDNIETFKKVREQKKLLHDYIQHTRKSLGNIIIF